MMEISGVTSLYTAKNTKCVECMCLMTLLQEHVSSKHSTEDLCPYFELSEWQQSGYKQIIKWTLECDRCDFKTTSKTQMFEHIANHQLLEDTVHRIHQSAPGPPNKPSATPTQPSHKPSATPTQPSHKPTATPTQPSHKPYVTPIQPSHKPYVTPIQPPHKPSATPTQIHKPMISLAQFSQMPPVTLPQSSHNLSAIPGRPTLSTTEGSNDHTNSSDIEVKDEIAEPIIIHMEEQDISEVIQNRSALNDSLPQPLPLSWTPPHSHLPPMYNSEVNRQNIIHPQESQSFKLQTVRPTSNRPTSDTDDNDPFKCPWCGFSGPSADSLLYHSRLEHKMYNCAVCDYRGNKATDLEMHMNTIHKSMLCVYCGVDNGNARALRRHYSLDHGTKLKKCTKCPFTTLSKSELTQHFNREHFGRKPRKCSFCDYVAYADNHLRQHVSAIHEKQKPFHCPHCPRKFGRKFLVQDHMKRKHQVEMTPVISKSLDIGYKVARGEALMEQSSVSLAVEGEMLVDDTTVATEHDAISLLMP